MRQKFKNAKLKGWVFCCVMLTACSILFFGCAAPEPIKVENKIQLPRETKRAKPRTVPKLEIPDFAPVTEDLSPLKTRIVNISARNTPLSDVLHIVAETSTLNLVAERGVDLSTEITLTLKNVSVEEALNTIFIAVDYFYSVRNNMLIVKAIDTKIFEIGHPAITQTYNVSVGGDILSGAASAAGGGGDIRGTVTQNVTADATAFDFWTAIEQSLTNVIASGQAPTGEGLQQTVIINRMTGTVFVTATKRNLERVEKFINIVKKVMSRQVQIEARIIEVQLTESMRYGIDWSFITGGAAGGVGGEVISAQNFSSAVSSALPAFSVNLTGGNLASVVRALQQQGEVRTLSNPRISIMNGQTSLLSVGRAESFVSEVNTTISEGVTTYSISTSSILSGMVLGIVPFINENDEISMTITPIISSLVKLEKVSVGSGGETTEISLPTVDLKELSTTIKVKDGQLIIIGGLISKSENFDENKVPGLGDVPMIGNLFKSKEKITSRSELVVLLLPRIIS